jgi:Leucine-rich repeat (LRR) protein
LDLAENKFVGGIPTELSLLTHLHKLHLHQSSGADLNGTLPAFDNFPDLVELALDSNSFSGTIPSNFMAGVSNKSQPILMDLRNNEIVGSIPSELKNFGNLTIYLEGNKIDAIPSDLCTMDDWMNGEVGKVGSCDAILCPTGFWNLYGKASVREGASCLPCASSTVFGSTSCGSNEDPFPEKTILDSLFKLTGGERYWYSSAGWTDNTLGICFREGITCSGNLSNNSNAGVTEILLPLNGLGGVIPPSIFDIPNLRVINLSENEVDISFADIAKATNLEVLQMANTKLKSLAGIEKAPLSLYKLDFAGNDMSGTIPSELFKLSNVKTLLLGTNHFSGTISSSITGLSNIMTLDISNNEITGLLPTELGLMTTLSALMLGINQLSGVLVTEIGRLTDLTMLSLAAQRSSDKLSGALVAFNTSPKLSYLDLSDNAITGLIPGDFLSGVNPSKDITVNLSGNNITGAVPASLDRFQLLDIDLTGNKIDTLPGDFCDNGGWMDGNVDVYGCDAIVCRPGTAAEFGRQVDSGSECQSCPGGEQDAPYFGATECMASGVEADRNILMALYQALNGENWKEQANWMSEDSVCIWYGVTCDSDGSVVSLELKSNNLDSETDISSLVFLLPKLTTLDLSGLCYCDYTHCIIFFRSTLTHHLSSCCYKYILQAIRCHLTSNGFH